MRTRVTVTALFAAALLTACGSISGNAGTVVSNASPTAQDAGAALTAEQIASQLAINILRLDVTITYDKDSDPEGLLGQPHGYTSKVAFSDGRIPKSDTAIFSKGDVEVGGLIEVFADAADLRARLKQLKDDGTKGGTALFEYDYVKGAVLVRVSHYLSPAQAAEYQSAVKQLS
jgi:hypothetical protein